MAFTRTVDTAADVVFGVAGKLYLSYDAISTDSRHIELPTRPDELDWESGL